MIYGFVRRVHFTDDRSTISGRLRDELGCFAGNLPLSYLHFLATKCANLGEQQMRPAMMMRESGGQVARVCSSNKLCSYAARCVGHHQRGYQLR